MNDLVQTIILGAIQGFTEFIPISSSGHLVVVRELFGFTDQGLAFDAVLHLATLLVVIIYFWQDWRNILESIFTKKNNHKIKQSRKLFASLVITTVPAIGAGLLFKDFMNDGARSLALVASLMVFTGLMFLLIERIAVAKKDISKLTFFDALSIGLAQAAAILPGISRSGATMITGMYHGLKRETAARYAFLASGPIIAIAGIYSLWQLLASPEIVSWQNLGVGFGVSMISGFIAIHLMLQFLRSHKLNVFAGYLIIVGVGLLVFNFS